MPDAMHTIQRCLLNIHNLYCGRNDTLQVRKQEKTFGRFQECWPNYVVKQKTVNSRKRKSLTNTQPTTKKKDLPESCSGGNDQSERLVQEDHAETLMELVVPPAPYVIKDEITCNKRFLSVVFPNGKGIKRAPIFTAIATLPSGHKYYLNVI